MDGDEEEGESGKKYKYSVSGVSSTEWASELPSSDDRSSSSPIARRSSISSRSREASNVSSTVEGQRAKKTEEIPAEKYPVPKINGRIRNCRVISPRNRQRGAITTWYKSNKKSE